MKKFILITLLIASFSATVNAQSTFDSKSRISKIELGYSLGGTLRYHYVASYNGINVGLFHGYKLSDRFHLSGGFNIEKLSDRTILPLSADIDFYNKKGNQVFNIRAGYAAIWGTRAEVETNYKYKGGLQYSLGYGFQLFKTENWKLSFLASYNFRDTKLVYHSPAKGTNYEDPSKSHLISFKTIFSF